MVKNAGALANISPRQIQSLMNHLLTEAKVVDESGETLRLDVTASSDFDQWEAVGEVVFSFGQFGLFDKSEVDRCFDQMDDMDEYFTQLQNENQCGAIALPNDIQVPFFRCAEGAAVVSRLLQRKKPVGVQIRYGHVDDLEVN